MRRLACLLFAATLLTGCPSEDPQDSPETPPATTQTDEQPDAATETPTETPKGPEGLSDPAAAEGKMGLQAMGKCPVSGEDVDLTTAITYVWGDTTYVFCTEECLERFKANPKTFAQ